MKYKKPYRIKKKKSILKNRFFWLAILIFMVICGIFYLFFVSPVFKIKEIEIAGNQKVVTSDVQNIAKEVLLSGRNNFFLVDESKIENEILNNYPQIAKANPRLKFPHRLIIEIEERKPVAVFHQTNKPDSTATSSESLEQRNDNYFYIDKDGIIFESVLEMNSAFPKIQDSALNNEELKLGEKIVGGEKIKKILEINSKLKDNFEIPLGEFFILPEERVNVETLENWEIYFNLKEDINWQLTKLGAVLEKEIPPGKRRNLEYIDVRFGNLAPFKYKD